VKYAASSSSSSSSSGGGGGGDGDGSRRRRTTRTRRRMRWGEGGEEVIYFHAFKAFRGSGVTAPFILNLSNR
jgi:hypothetical protein